MRDHGSIGLLLGNGFLVGNLALSVFGLFLFCFCLVRGEKVTDAQDFWLAIKGRGPLQVMVSFLSLFGGDNSVLFRLSGPKTFLHISFVFFRSLIRNFLSFSFCFLPIFDREFSSFSFLLSKASMGNFTLGQGLW